MAKGILEKNVREIEGKSGELVDRGDNTYGGKWVINPSGGLISKGHPIGATGASGEGANWGHGENETTT